MKIDDPIFIPVWLAVVAIVPQILQTVASFVINMRVRDLHNEVKDAKGEIINTKGAVINVKEEVNGRMTELLNITKESAHAKGVLEEKDRQTNGGNGGSGGK